MKFKSQPVYLKFALFCLFACLFKFALLSSNPSPLHLSARTSDAFLKRGEGHGWMLLNLPPALTGQSPAPRPGQREERSELPLVPLTSVLCFQRGGKVDRILREDEQGWPQLHKNKMLITHLFLKQTSPLFTNWLHEVGSSNCEADQRSKTCSLLIVSVKLRTTIFQTRPLVIFLFVG